MVKDKTAQEMAAEIGLSKKNVDLGMQKHPKEVETAIKKAHDFMQKHSKKVK